MEKGELMRDAGIEDGFLPHEFVGSAAIKDNPEDLAVKLHKN